MGSMSLLTTFGVMAYVLLTLTAAPASCRSMNAMTMNEIPSRIYKTNVDKRFDPACKGIFDPELYKKLDAICQDCYYLYYDEQLTTRCRSDCFMNDTFRYCTVDMLYPEEEYVSIARKLHSKAG